MLQAYNAMIILSATPVPSTAIDLSLTLENAGYLPSDNAPETANSALPDRIPDRPLM